MTKRETLLTVTGIHCELSMRIDKRGGGTALLVLLSLVASSGNSPPFFTVQVDGAPEGKTDQIREYGMFADGTASQSNSTPIPLAVNRWAHLSISIAPALSPNVTAAIDGATVVARTHGEFARLPPLDLKQLTIGTISDDYSGGSSGWRVLYDNVACDTVP